MNKLNYKILMIIIGMVLLLGLLGMGIMISQREPSHKEPASTEYFSDTEGDSLSSEHENETGGSGEQGNSGTTDKTEESENTEETQDPGDMDDTENTEEPEDTEIPGNPPALTEDFTMFFTGDVLLKDKVMGGYNKKGINGLISEYLEQEMVSANMTMINEEFPFSTRGIPMENKKFTFRIDPKYVKVFHEMGIDVVSLANNHALDYGDEALIDTFATLDEAGIPYAGAGSTKARAEEAVFVEAGGRKIGVLSASRVIPVVGWNIENHQPGLFCTYSSTRMVARIKEIEQECDFVVVYVHWGKEYQEYPENYQRELAKKYIDAGADLVVGSHPHVPQGIEYYKGVPIVYSLGNFIFSANMVDTYAVKAIFDQNGETHLQVIPVGIAKAYTQELTGDKKTEFYKYLESISFGIDIDENGFVTEEISVGDSEL